MKITPLRDYCLVLPIEDKKSEHLILPEQAGHYKKGLVIKIGKKVTEVKPKDKIHFIKYHHCNIQIKGEEVLLVQEEDILGVEA